MSAKLLHPNVPGRGSRSRGGARESRQEPTASGYSADLLRLVVLPALLLLAAALVTVRPIPDPDVWFHMALGREVVENGSLPRQEMFSYTAAGREWISSGWGASVALYLAHKWAGPSGLLWLTFGVVGAAHLLVYFAVVRRYGSAGSIALLQLAGMLAAYLRYTPRPDIWSQFFIAATLLLLIRADERSDSKAAETTGGASCSNRSMWALWALPVLQAVWANFHAGFPAGLLAVAVYGAFRVQSLIRSRDRRELLTLLPLALCGVAWMANPYGWRLLALAGKIEAIPHVQEKIYEWKPMWAAGPIALPWPTYVGFALLCAGALGVMFLGRPADRRTRKEGRPIPWWTLTALLVFAGLAIWQRRHAGLAGVAIPALLVPWVATLEARVAAFGQTFSARAWRMTAGAAAAVCLIGALQFNGTLGVGRGLFQVALNGSLLPVFATNWLQSNPLPGTIYNTYGAGGYLLYHLSPATKVFIDGRLDCYDHKTWLDYLAIEEGKKSLADAAKEYGINSFVLYSRDAIHDPNHLVFRLTDDPQWDLVYYDDSYVVFVKRGPETQDFIAAHAVQYANPFDPNKFRKALKNPVKRAEALAELDRIRTLPGNGGAWTGALAAMAARSLGDASASQQLLATALSRDPQNPLARALQAEIQ